MRKKEQYLNSALFNLAVRFVSCDPSVRFNHLMVRLKEGRRGAAPGRSHPRGWWFWPRAARLVICRPRLPLGVRRIAIVSTAATPLHPLRAGTEGVARRPGRRLIIGPGIRLAGDRPAWANHRKASRANGIASMRSFDRSLGRVGHRWGRELVEPSSPRGFDGDRRKASVWTLTLIARERALRGWQWRKRSRRRASGQHDGAPGLAGWQPAVRRRS